MKKLLFYTHFFTSFIFYQNAFEFKKHLGHHSTSFMCRIWLKLINERMKPSDYQIIRTYLSIYICIDILWIFSIHPEVFSHQISGQLISSFLHPGVIAAFCFVVVKSRRLLWRRKNWGWAVTSSGFATICQKKYVVLHYKYQGLEYYNMGNIKKNGHLRF